MFSVQEFKKNVKGVNGGSDFNQEMLDEVYNAVKLVHLLIILY